MPEPTRAPVRPIRMMRVALVAALLVLAGCGSAEQGSGPADDGGSTTSSTSPTVGSCRAGSSQVTGARQVAAVDLDGDGTSEPVKVTAPGGECPDLLFARVGERFVSTSVADNGPAATSGFAIEVPGHDGQMLVTRADHPRGGYQLRVYAAGDEALVELEVDGGTLVPFVVTDVQEHPFSIDCTSDGMVLTEAVLHEPVGIVPAWDVTRTTYAVDGTTVTAGTAEEVADNVLTRQLGAKYPELLAHAAFESCRAG